MTEYNQFIFSGTLVHSNIFRLRLIRAISDAWFTQNNFLTELNLTNFWSALFGYHDFSISLIRPILLIFQT